MLLPLVSTSLGGEPAYPISELQIYSRVQRLRLSSLNFLPPKIPSINSYSSCFEFFVFEYFIFDSFAIVIFYSCENEYFPDTLFFLHLFVMLGSVSIFVPNLFSIDSLAKIGIEFEWKERSISDFPSVACFPPLLMRLTIVKPLYRCRLLSTPRFDFACPDTDFSSSIKSKLWPLEFPSI